MDGKDGRGKGGVGLSGVCWRSSRSGGEQVARARCTAAGLEREAAAGRAFAWNKAPGELPAGAEASALASAPTVLPTLCSRHASSVLGTCELHACHSRCR